MSEKKPSTPTETPSKSSSEPVTRPMTEAEKAEWIPYAVKQVELNRAYQAKAGLSREPQTPEEEALARLD